MHLAVYLPLLAPVAVLAMIVVATARSWADHLHPAVAAWALTVGAVLLGTAGTAALALLVLAGAAGLSASTGWEHWSAHVLARADPVAVPAGAVAAVALVAVAVRVVRAVVRLRAQHRAGHGFPTGRGSVPESRTPAARAGEPRLVMLDDPRPAAFASPGLGRRTGAMVVSRGMWDALPDPDERRALLAHERAHLSGRHHLLLAAGALAVATNPLLSPLRDELGYACERWSDESAARAVGDPATVARALARAALAASGHPAHPLAATTGPVPLRVAALLGRGPAPRPGVRVVAVTSVVLALLAVATVLHAVTDLHAMLEIAEQATT